MAEHRQTTIAEQACVSGVGLHTGAEVRAVLKPARENSGVVFRPSARHDADISANPDHVVDTRLGVTLSAGGASIRTVEHLMAAIWLANLDNVIVEVEGPEIPILDGSAAPFLDLIENAGVYSLDAARAPRRFAALASVEDGERRIEMRREAPGAIEVSIAFEDAAIGRQSVTLPLAKIGDWKWRVASARTFCSLGEIEAMRASGLGRGGSLDNAVVVDGERIVNEGGLRDANEFALHKALDLIGDLALAGVRFPGRISAHKPGHEINRRAARILAGAPPARGVATAATAPENATA